MPIDATDGTLQLIQKVKDEQGDAFRLRILRKKNDMDLSPVSVATFDSVLVQQIWDAEIWLPTFVGAGLWALRVSHMKTVAQPVGAPLVFRIEGQAHLRNEVNFAALAAPDWRGPINLISPVAQEPGHVVTIAASGAPVAPRAPESPSAEAARLAQSASAGQATGDAYRAAAMLAEAERQRADLAKREADLSSKEGRIEALRDELRSRPPVDPMGGSAGLMEFFKMMLQQQQAADQRSREDRQAAEERGRREKQDSDERSRDAQVRQDERFAKVLETLSKPDPIREALIQKALMGKDDAAEMMAKNAASTSALLNTITGATMQLMQTKLEMNNLEQGEQDSPMFRLVGRGVDLVERMMESKSPREEEEEEEVVEGAEGEEEIEDAQVVDASALKRFDTAIHTLQAPAILIPLFFKAMQTKEFEGIYNKAKGNLENIATERYGGWAMGDLPKRQRYLHVVLPRCFEAAVLAGLLERTPAKTDQPAAAAEAAPKRPQGKKTKRNGTAAPQQPEAAAVVEQAGIEDADFKPTSEA